MRSIRLSIVCITFILLMFGVVMVYSSSAIYASQVFGDGMFYLRRHLLGLVLGVALGVFVMLIDCDFIKKYARHILFFSMILLVIALIPGVGKSAGGAKRWISLGLFNIQPSEIAKIAVLIYLADFIERHEHRMTDLFYGYIPPMIVIGAVMLLIVVEPDLGTTITIGTIGLVLLFISGVRLKYIFFTACSAIPFIWYLVFSVPYRRKRILAFINPWMDEKGVGFQIIQSFLALGSGGLFGVGLGQAKQKLFYLPAAHTDFIFSIIGEELGFIGTFSVLLLFFVLIWQGARAAFKVEDVFRKTLIFGVVFTIAIEVIINVGVSTGIVPTKGLPLPFLSYGGTSLVIHMVAVALLLNATRER